VAAINFTAIDKILATVLAVLGVVTATAGVDTSKVVAIVQKVATALGVIQNLSDPNSVSAAMADLSAILAEVKAAFPNAGPQVDEAVAAAEKFQAVVNDYKSGQAALIDSNFSFFGIEGDLVAVSKGGPAAQALGL